MLGQVLDNDGIVTGAVDDFITLFIPLPHAKNHMLREDHIDEKIPSHQVGLDHHVLTVVDLVRYGELVEDILDTIRIDLAAVTEEIGDEGVKEKDGCQ